MIENRLNYDDLDKKDDECKKDNLKAVIRSLLYSPFYYEDLFDRSLMPKDEFDKVLEDLHKKKLIKVIPGDKGVIIGLSDEMRKDIGLKFEMLKASTCYFHANTKRKIMEITFYHPYDSKTNRTLIEIPLANFGVAVRNDLQFNPRYRTKICHEDFILARRHNKIPVPTIIKEPKETDDICRIISCKQRREILERQDYKCNNCGRRIVDDGDYPEKSMVAHIDHIHPFALRHTYFKGPEAINETENLQALCATCNRSKGMSLN